MASSPYIELGHLSELSYPGIIRGIDVQRGILYVITPVPLEHLQRVDLLLQGLIEIPKSLLQVTFPFSSMSPAWFNECRIHP
jgi:hypothetical protein